MSGEGFGTLLADSLAVMAAESPLHAAALAAALGAAPVDFAVGAERVRVWRGPGGRVVVGPVGGGAPAVRVVTGRAEILALLDGRRSLATAVREGALDLYGTPGEIARFIDVLVIYLHGAVRCPGMAGILARWRALGAADA